MPPTVQIRPATTPSEIAQVRTLLTAYGQHLAANPTGAVSICIADYDRQLAALPGLYAPPDGALLLALVGDGLDAQPAGCCAIRPFHSKFPEIPIRRAVEMKRLWVDPAFRGLHLGRRLIQSTLDFALETRCSAIYLDTVPAAMPEANRLYQSFGFRPTAPFHDDPIPRVVFFVKELLVQLRS